MPWLKVCSAFPSLRDHSYKKLDKGREARVAKVHQFLDMTRGVVGICDTRALADGFSEIYDSPTGGRRLLNAAACYYGTLQLCKRERLRIRSLNTTSATKQARARV